MATAVDLYIKHVVDMHSEVQLDHEVCDKEDGSSSRRDSGTWSLDMPGADLSQEDFTEEFSNTAIPVASSEMFHGISLEDDSEMIPGITYLVDSPSPVIKLKTKRKKRRRRRSSSIDSVIARVELEEKVECSVCTGLITYNTELVTLECCNKSVCVECMEAMITVRVKDGLTFIPCPNPDCTKAFQRDLIVKHIKDSDIRSKYERFRLNIEGDGSKKTCPNCCLVTECNLPAFNSTKKTQLTPDEYNIECSECSFHWCFNCHSPWHEGLSCHSYRMGDKQFMKWTKGRKSGYTPNCQRCPKCKVYIERSTGCDSMTCNRCHTNFCYKCGGKFKSFPGLGNHYKHLSVYGCPYNYLPEKTAKRRLVRGGYLFAKGAALTGFPILLVGGVAIVAVGAVIVLPVAGGIVGGVIVSKAIGRRMRQ